MLNNLPLAVEGLLVTVGEYPQEGISTMLENGVEFSAEHKLKGKKNNIRNSQWVGFSCFI